MQKPTLPLAVAALMLAATTSAQAAAGRDYIAVVGSSTVYPFTTAVAEQFGKTTKFKTPKIESTGTGGGLGGGGGGEHERGNGQGKGRFLHGRSPEWVMGEESCASLPADRERRVRVVFGSCYQRRSKRLRRYTARPFMHNSTASSTRIAAEVRSTKARSGESAHR